MTIRISLTAQNFSDLVSGRVVETIAPDSAAPRDHKVEIALQDIGWRVMLDAIETAMPAGEKAFHRRIRRTIDDAAEHGQILTWEDAVAIVTTRMRSPHSPRRSEGAREAWETRRRVNAYMDTHPGISRDDALAAVQAGRD